MSRLRFAIWLGVALAALAVAVPAEGAFPGKNGKIAFVSNRDDTQIGNLEIYTTNPDGSDVTRLTTNPLPDEDPAWSPDGSKIAFDGDRGDHHVIVVVNADGTGETAIPLPGLGTYPTGDPSWSPDGRKIVFQGNTGKATNLYTVNSDGSGGLTQLTHDSSPSLTPSWSPDGSRIAFSRYVPVPPCAPYGCNWEIFVMNADGTGETRLTFDAGADQDTNPNWSPDGRKIAWDKDVARYTRIQVMNADGTDQVDLAAGANPSWSPDGRKIVWAGFSEPLNSNEINVMNADGSDQHSVTNSPTFDAFPDWQPIPGPKRSDFKNSNQFCKAEQAFWGDQFASRYGGGANAFGKCVSQNH